MIRSVMLPLDFTRDSGLALHFCSGLVDLGVRRVVVCHVIDATGLEGPVIAAKVDQVRQEIRAVVAPLADAGLDVEVRLPTGALDRELVAVAAESRVDAIVCSTAGKTMTDQLLLGSISEFLVRTVGVPSITVRQELLRNVGDPADLARRFAKCLLVPTDFSGTATRAFDCALALPPKAVGSIRLLHVLPRSDEPARAKRDEDGASYELRDIAAVAKEHGLTAVPVLGHGEPERAIMAEIDESRVTGVVIGTHGRSPFEEAFLGSVSMTLLRQASCPVMIVP
jgi:nucleotide-binding universal stress UspA family protein